MKGVPDRLLVFIAVASAASIYLIWRGQGRGDSTGTVITVSGVVGLLSLAALLVAIMVNSRKK
jgi:hypothetical protein